jgi:hypothetical protein
MLSCEMSRVTPLEGREGKEDLDYGGHVTAVVRNNGPARICRKRRDKPITEVLKTCEAGPKDGLKRIPCFIRQREFKVEVLLDFLIAIVRAQRL